MLVSNRAKGTGWKFFLPVAVMAGFLVLAKRGLILSLRICSMTDQKAEESASVCVFLANFCSIALAFSASSVVDQGSRLNVKLASAITMSALLVAFSIGR